jgi:hypothetical protein
MLTTAISTEAGEAAIREAYQRGREDQADECSQRHLVRIADVLDAIDQHAGNVEQLRSSILTAIGHATP